MMIFTGQKVDDEYYKRYLKLLVWLLPVPNRDTLEHLLDCLKTVAQHSEDQLDENGNIVSHVLFLWLVPPRHDGALRSSCLSAGTSNVVDDFQHFFLLSLSKFYLSQTRS